MTPEKKAEQILNSFYTILDAYSEYDFYNAYVKECAINSIDILIENSKQIEITVLHTDFGKKLKDINGEIRVKYSEFVLYYLRVRDKINNF
jgi:hypothetical protein